MKSSRNLLVFLLLVASASAASITWDQPNASNNWNTTDANWAGAATFVNGDSVTFNSATGETVLVDAAGVSPASTTVSSAGNWTFAVGSIAGTLDKSGAGTLTLSNSNTFSATSLSGGSLTLGNIGALGSGTLTVASGAKSATTEGGLGGSGSAGNFLFLSGITGVQTFANAITLPNDATTTYRKIAVQGSGGTVHGANTYNFSGLISGGGVGTNLYLDVATGGDGYSVVRLSNSSNSFTGKIEFNRGSLQIDSDTVLGASTNSLNADGFTVSKLIFNYTGNYTHPTTVTTATNFDTIGNTVNASAALTLNAALTKIGSGTLTLSAANTGAGGVRINQGPNTQAAGAINVANNSAFGTGAVTFTNTAAITALYNSAASQTITNNIALSGTASITTRLLVKDATSFELNGIVSGGAATATLLVDTNLSNSTGFLKLGNAANTFLGKVQLNRGGLAITADGSLGNAANSIVIDVGNTTQTGLRFDAAINSARAIQLGGGKQVLDTVANDVALSGVISGTGQLFKSGSGKLTLTGNSTYSGGTAISAGTLQIGSAGTTGSLGGGSVANSGSLILNRSDALTVSNAISGTGSLTQSGSGTTTLSGSNSYTGTTTVNAGVLNVTGSLSSSTALNLAGGEFRLGTALDPIGSLTTSSLTQSGGTLSLDVSGSQSDLMTVTGNYTQSSGGITVNVVSAPTEGVPYTIVAYTGTLSANPPVTFTGLSGSRLTGNVDYGTGSNSAITVTFVGVPANLVWTGATNNTWDVNTTQNWKNGVSSDTFFQQDNVTFDDSPTSGNFSPVLDFNALCGSVVFNNSSNTYTLTGTGGITGATQIQMTGSGTTILATNNSNSGQVTVSLGTLQIGNGGTVGSLGSGDVIVDSSLVFNRSDDSTLGNAVFGSGTITKQGAGSLIVTGALGQIGDLIISAGSVSLGNGGTTGSVTSANIVDNANLTINRSANLALSNAISGSGSLSKLGAATLTLPNANSYTGGTSLGGGNLNLGNTGALGTGAITVGTGASTGTTTTAMLVTTSLTTSAFIANPITLPNDTVASNRAIYMSGVGNGTNTLELSGKISGGSSLSTLYLNNDQVGAFNPQVILSNAANDFTATLNINRGGLRIASNEVLGNATNTVVFNSNGGADLSFLSAMTYTHATTLTTATDFDTGSNAVTASGVISGIAGITKIGSGTLILSNTDTYAGATTVNAGTLQVNGTLSTSAAAVTVSATATLSGAGTINRPVTVSGTIAPGDGVGILSVMAATTVNGTLAADIDGASADKLAVTGNLSLGAGSALTLNLLPGGFTQPSYVIAECTGTLSGTFATIPSGYTVTYTSTQAILTPVTGYSSWATANGLDGTPGKESGPSDDPDKDGLANLLEYMLNGDPLGNSSTILPVGTNDATSLTLTFNRRDDSETDTTQVVEFGSTLTGWTPVAIPSAGGTTVVVAGGKSITFTLSENGTDPDHLVVEIPVGTDATLFARVKATK
jgi:fibronectin-binding autotransporter adhesin